MAHVGSPAEHPIEPSPDARGLGLRGRRRVRERRRVQGVDVHLRGERPTLAGARVHVLALGLLVVGQVGIAVLQPEGREVGDQLAIGAVGEAVLFRGVVALEHVELRHRVVDHPAAPQHGAVDVLERDAALEVVEDRVVDRHRVFRLAAPAQPLQVLVGGVQRVHPRPGAGRPHGADPEDAGDAGTHAADGSGRPRPLPVLQGQALEGLAKVPKDPRVKVQDQFGTVSLDLLKPIRLCAPANKRNEDLSAPQHLFHLLCYKTKNSAFGTVQTYTNDQFGPAQPLLIHRRELCVPSTKNGAVPTTTTTTSAPVTTTTSSTGPITTTTTGTTTSTTAMSSSGAFLDERVGRLD